MAFSGNPNPNPNPNNCTYFADNIDPTMEFEFSDYLVLDDGFAEEDSLSQSMASSGQVMGGSTGSIGATPTNSNIKYKNVRRRKKLEAGHRVAFRTKSELEVMDDGYKWRKYGKKSVKNSPNPRNYYKCSSGGCHVKKRIERDREDASYVITTYEGVHNHESPCMVYYSSQIQMPPNSTWVLQPNSPPSSSST